MPPATYEPLPAPRCACRRPLVDRHDVDADGTGLHCVRCGRTVPATTNTDRPERTGA